MSEGSAAKVNMAFIVAIVAVATIGGFMFGYDSGVINGTQKGLESAFDLGSLGIGVNVGAILVGSSIGAFGAGRMADIIGRRGVMMLSAILFLVSALLAGAAGSSAVFIIARIVGGLGVGAASVISPVYISEVTPAAIRGRLSSVQQVMIISGLTGAFVANFVLARHAGGSTAPLWLDFPAWRWMFWLQAIPAAIYLLALLFIPESPRYLVARGREDEALAVLTRLFGAQEAARKEAQAQPTARGLAKVVPYRGSRFSCMRADPASGTLLAARVPFEAPEVLVGGGRFTQDEWRRRGVHVKAKETNGRCIHVGCTAKAVDGEKPTSKEVEDGLYYKAERKSGYFCFCERHLDAAARVLGRHEVLGHLDRRAQVAHLVRAARRHDDGIAHCLHHNERHEPRLLRE